MKGLDRFILVLFSIVIIIMSVTFVLISAEMIKQDVVIDIVKNFMANNKVIILILGSLFALIGLVGIFSSSDFEGDMHGGLAIKSETGNIYINKETFESIISSVTKSYAELKNVRVDMQITENGVVANVYALILPDTVVPILTSKLQENIKSSVLKQTTVDIKEVNIKIRGVYQEAPRK